MALDLPATPKRDSWGRYLIVPRTGGKAKAYTRATTIAETLDDRYNLELWKMRQVAVGLARRPDLVARVAAEPDNKTAVNALCKEALDASDSGAAANLGTALHAVLERVNRGTDDAESVPEMFRPTVEAYVEALDTHGVAVHRDCVERIHVLERLGIAGMADLHVTIGGVRHIADIKTGSGIDFGARGFAVQLAIYAAAETLYNLDDDTHDPMPPVDQRRAVIIHVPAAGGEVALHWLDIAAGAEALEHAVWTRGWRKRKDLLEAIPTNTERIARSFNATVSELVHGKPTPPRPPARTDDEGVIDPKLVDKVKAAVEALDMEPAQEAAVTRWVAEGDDSPRPWRILDVNSMRRYHLYRVACRLAGWCWADGEMDDDLARNLLSIGLDEAVQPAVAIGAAIGALTVDEAKRLVDILDAGQVRFDDSGRATA